MPELPLDDDQRHALAGHLDGVRVPQLVRREASPDAGLPGDVSQLAQQSNRSLSTGENNVPRGAPMHTFSCGVPMNC